MWKSLEGFLKTEAAFNLWMDIYPESEPCDLNSKIQKAHVEAMDEIGLNVPENWIFFNGEIYYER